MSPARVQHGRVPSALRRDGASALSRDPVPALTDRRGPDGAHGDTAVCPGQVLIHTNDFHRFCIHFFKLF